MATESVTKDVGLTDAQKLSEISLIIYPLEAMIACGYEATNNKDTDRIYSLLMGMDRMAGDIAKLAGVR